MINRENILSYVASTLFIIVTTVGAFAGGTWGVVGIAGSIVLFLGTTLLDRRMPGIPKDLAIIILLTLGTVALLNLETTQPELSWHVWLQLVTIFLPLMMLFSPQIEARVTPPHLPQILVVGAATGAMMLGVELYYGAPLLHLVHGREASLTQYNRGLSYLVLLSMPIMAWLWSLEKRGSFFLFAILLFIPTCLTESRAAKLALFSAGLVIVFAHLFPIFTRRALAGVLLLLCAWPFAVQEFFLKHYAWLKQFPDSWRARVEIWDYMSYRIMEHPWLGWGLGTSHTLPFEDPHGAQYLFAAALPAPHPHNAIIQLWVELGIPGLALGIGFALFVLWKASRLNAELAPFAIGAWVAALALSLTAYNFWTDASFASFAMTGFVFAGLQKKFILTNH